ncbi:SAM-dependent methyltransferase [Rhodococcoides trifolii]|uniref:SAM-dependent methyltransferase n=1 Tax=Rhodococcoides trifolii TaxID=908250 RepID=A0A917D2B5_9NOCA|nr:methyltransferase [Rhodococcus trifolii]GGG08414.1 SAM-dependent methyltransferase [Rhodococcus trifolii]
MTDSPPVDRAALLALCPSLRASFLRCSYDADSVLALLGDDVHAALGRAEPVPVRRACVSAGELGTLIRLFLLADDLPATAVEAALAPVSLSDAARSGLVAVEGDVARAALDVRPVDFGNGNRWVVSDIDGSTRALDIGSDHVLGVGQASLSLIRATPTDPVASVLDLGIGCGVQAVHAAAYGSHVTGTDVSERSMTLAAMTAALNGLEFELLRGSWFEPVVGRTFERVVANPPFVVGPAQVQHSYRDSGLDLDGASALVISTAPGHLEHGGLATLLAAWLHVDGEDWQSRVASWLPDHGVDAWILQRDVADPALYVGTWMRDGGVDLRSPASGAQAEAWLDRLEQADVTGVGFGVVYLRRTDRPTQVVAEDLSHGFDDPLGPEAPAWFDRLDWVREHDVLASTFALDPATALEEVSLPSGEGWSRVVTRVHRGNGPQWSHEIDELGAALLAGLRHDGLPAGELVSLLAAAHGVDPDDLGEGAEELLTALLLHGLITPG